MGSMIGLSGIGLHEPAISQTDKGGIVVSQCGDGLLSLYLPMCRRGAFVPLALISVIYVATEYIILHRPAQTQGRLAPSGIGCTNTQGECIYIRPQTSK